MAIERFRSIGLEINFTKSVAINISCGKLNPNYSLLVAENATVPCLGPNEFVRYLGVNFADACLFDSQVTLNDLKNKLDLLISSPLLNPDQKFCILNS